MGGMAKQRIAIWCIGAATLVVLGCIAVWILLATWVPTQGKARLVEELERLGPIHVSINTVQYRPLQGFLLDDVLVEERGSGTPWLKAPQLTLRINWWSLLLQQHVVFYAHAPLELPAVTQLKLAGRYRVHQRHLRCRIQTTEIPIESLGDALAAFVPPPLRAGRVALDLSATWQPSRSLHVAGQVIGTGLFWTEEALGARGDITLEGTATAPLSADARWTLDAVTTLRRGIVEGLPGGASLTNVEALGRLTQERLDIQRLTGAVMGFPVRLEATLEPLTRPSVEALIISHLDLTALSTLVAPFLMGQPGWTMTGAVDATGVCRGPLQWSPGSEESRDGILNDPTISEGAEGPTPQLDCLAQVIVQDASVMGPKLPQPLTGLQGRLDYDMLTRELGVPSLQMRMGEESLAVQGRIGMTAPAPEMALELTGTLPLGAITPWLPDSTLMTQLAGRAELDVHVGGTLTTPRLNGQAIIRDGSLMVKALAHPLDDIDGTLHFTEQTLESHDLQLRLDEHLLRLSGRVSDWDTEPTLSGTIQTAENTLEATVRLPKERVIIDRSTLTLPHSTLQLRGELARSPSSQSHLTLQGTLELADLAALPLVTLPVEPSLIEGPLRVGIQIAGPLGTWKSLTARASVYAERVRIQTVPVAQGTLEAEQADGTLRIRIPQARVADGTLWGELLAEHRATTTYGIVKFELTGLQLAQLARSIPAWREREIGGLASAKALISGDWDARATWVGEGWLNASGERLGNVPILDKVFQGLFGTLADRLGLESVRRAHITQASAQWKLSQERIFTEDLRLGGVAGTEPVAVYAKGSVGLDQTLDFIIEPEFSEQTVLQAPNTSTVANTLLKAAGQLDRLRRLIGRHRLIGTLKKPEYRFEVSPGEVFKQLGPGPVELLQGFLESIR